MNLNNITMDIQLYEMLESMAKSEISKAKMSLKLLGEKAVGIGDHSTDDFYNNADDALSKLAEAEDKLKCLEKNYKQQLKP